MDYRCGPESTNLNPIERALDDWTRDLCRERFQESFNDGEPFIRTSVSQSHDQHLIPASSSSAPSPPRAPAVPSDSILCRCNGATNSSGSGGADCSSVYNNSRFCYTDVGVCSDGLQSSQVAGVEWSHLACSESCVCSGRGVLEAESDCPFGLPDCYSSAIVSSEENQSTVVPFCWVLPGSCADAIELDDDLAWSAAACGASYTTRPNSTAHYTFDFSNMRYEDSATQTCTYPDDVVSAPVPTTSSSTSTTSRRRSTTTTYSTTSTYRRTSRSNKKILYILVFSMVTCCCGGLACVGCWYTSQHGNDVSPSAAPEPRAKNKKRRKKHSVGARAMPGKEETAALPEAAQPFDVDGIGVLDESSTDSDEDAGPQHEADNARVDNPIVVDREAERDAESTAAGKEETAALPEAAQPFDVDGNGVLDEVEVATMLAAMGNPQGRSPSSVT
jgi:hypothetical protein